MDKLFSIRVERVLHRAATDADFKDRLLQDREATARELGIEPGSTEWELLRAIPPAQLEGAIASLAQVTPAPGRRTILGIVATTAATAVVATGACGCMTGAEPSVPPSDKGIQDGFNDVRPAPDAGPAPDTRSPDTRGRPDAGRVDAQAIVDAGARDARD
jgi:hypothetical protein